MQFSDIVIYIQKNIYHFSVAGICLIIDWFNDTLVSIMCGGGSNYGDRVMVGAG
jgi:hypothetical protein